VSTGSILRNAMETTKERCCMVSSISKVAMIWVSAPTASQTRKVTLTRGSDARCHMSTMIRNSTAKGRAKRNRTWVAPAAPSGPLSSRCKAFRAVWPAAAARVKTTHRKFMKASCGLRRLRGAGPDIAHPVAEIDHSRIDGQACRNIEKDVGQRRVGKRGDARYDGIGDGCQDHRSDRHHLHGSLDLGDCRDWHADPGTGQEFPQA